MAFTDWDPFGVSAEVESVVDSLTPIEGSQSIRIAKFAGAGGFNRGANVVPKDASGLTHGITAGRMRTLFRAESNTAGHNFGINAMQPNDDVSTVLAAGTFYRLVIHPDLNTIEIEKRTGRTSDGVVSILATASTPVTIVVGTVYAMEFLWFADLVEFGGTLLVAKFGQLTDYSDLTEVPGLNVIDTSLPVTSSVAEGLGYSDGSNTGLGGVTYDKTQLYSVAFV